MRFPALHHDDGKGMDTGEMLLLGTKIGEEDRRRSFPRGYRGGAQGFYWIPAGLEKIRSSAFPKRGGSDLCAAYTRETGRIDFPGPQGDRKSCAGLAISRRYNAPARKTIKCSAASRRKAKTAQRRAILKALPGKA